MFERKAIYCSRKDESVILVLASNDDRTTYIRLKKNIIAPEMFKIKDFGFACIDSVYTSKNFMLHRKGYSEIAGNITNSEFRIITAGIQGLFNGDIESELGGFYYSDDADEIKAAIAEANAPKKSSTERKLSAEYNTAIQETILEFAKKYFVADDKFGVFCVDAFEKFKKHYDVEISIVKFVNAFSKAVQIEFGATKEHRAKKINKIVYMKGIRFRSVIIDEDSESMHDNTVVDTSNEALEENRSTGQLYDLLDDGDSNTSYTVRDSSIKPKTSRNTGAVYQVRRFYTEDEVLDIAGAMNIRVVMAKYNIESYAIAAQIKQNARRILGMGSERDTCNNNYIELWESGVTLEEALILFGEEYRSNIEGSYKQYQRHDSIDNDAAKAKWANPLMNATYEELAILMDSTSIRKFAEAECCTSNVANDIFRNIHTILSKNPLYCVFGPLAYNTDELCKHIKKCRSSGKVQDEIDVMLYDDIMKLFMAYKKSFDDHAAIVSGTMPIPDYVPDDKHDFFMTLIAKRFSIRVKYTFNITDKSLFSPSSNYIEIARKFIIRYDKIKSCIKSYYCWYKDHVA